MAKSKTKTVDTIKHTGDKRTNIPTAEFETVMQEQEKAPIRVAYERRNRDLDPQLVWRGKDEQDWSDLAVHAPPLYIQEKVHPKVLIDDLIRGTKERAAETSDAPSLFADFNGHSDPSKSTEFYSHQQNWTNRMILGDSLLVMASLAEREGLRGKVQCIYLDPPYGIKFNSNFQWSTTSRDVKDGKADHITREPEQVKAFRDTWRDGIHSYLTYLRDRLTVARDLLHESGSIFVQIGDENVHRVRALMDEVFGEENFVSLVTFIKTSGQTDNLLSSVSDYIVWFARDAKCIKYRQLFKLRSVKDAMDGAYRKVLLPTLQSRNLTKLERDDPSAAKAAGRVFRTQIITSQSPGTRYNVSFNGKDYFPTTGYWKTEERNMPRLIRAARIESGERTLSYVRFADDFPVNPRSNFWDDTGWSLGADKTYVVQTGTQIVERCILMTTDPGDLVLDPTCGSGTTAFVAEQWGRRWITIDTSRVALALARSRIMGARYPYYILSDTQEGLKKEAEISGTFLKERPTKDDIRLGFVYERVPHITLKSIANNAEIDVIWEKWQKELEPLRESLNKAAGSKYQEWEIPREADPKWSADAKSAHTKWWEARIARQKEIDASIAAKAEYEYLYDKPYADSSRVRVAGPFTVESISPHRMVVLDADGNLKDDRLRHGSKPKVPYGSSSDPDEFAQMVLDNLKMAGVQQAEKKDRITFHTVSPWPGQYIAAEGYYLEGTKDKRAGVFIGPEFGTVPRADLVAAAREAADAGFDVLVACAFNFDAHSSEFNKLGKIPVLKARMNPDLHMSAELKNTGHGNLFVVFGEPDVEILKLKDDMLQVKIRGVDVFKPQTGEIESGDADSIALWFIDTDYNEESFFVRHAYFLGAGDPYSALKSTLKAEIDGTAWESLQSDMSRPFKKPKSGRIAVKVINHLGDEVMKVFKV
ncbi:MAG: site-specific DNA-methyltransferase [Leptospirales bacterium]|nr:site-specific DNA-methyltransferase [Leptospirales bacterium]